MDPQCTAALERRLSQRQAEGLYRERRLRSGPPSAIAEVDGRRLINFCSNDYLGLATHPEVIAALKRGLHRYGAGSTASQLMAGHCQAHRELEEALAEFTGYSRALCFSTGYMANLGLLGSLLRRGDLVAADRLNHASLVDGVLLARARLRRYRHGNPAHLERLLSASDSERKYVLTDGVFSMDGDLAPLPALARCAARHRASLLVDDAHGLGVVGPQGRGVSDHFQLGPESITVLVGTFGKALGLSGAFVAGPEALIETLIQEARTYIYTTALPPAVAEAARTALGLVDVEVERRLHLQALIQRFRAGARALGLPLGGSATAIQPLILGDAGRTVQVSEALFSRGCWVAPIRPPTVPAGSARLRITLTAAHEAEHVDRLLEALQQALAS